MTIDHPGIRRLAVLALLFCLTVPAAYAAPIVLQAREAAPGTAVLELYVDELVTMTRVPFRLIFRDAGGRPVSGARVSCDMTMPSMAMPENRPKVAERDGAYTGEMIFTCAMGAWQISCVAEKDDGSRQTAVFDIDKVRMK